MKTSNMRRNILTITIVAIIILMEGCKTKHIATEQLSVESKQTVLLFEQVQKSAPQFNAIDFKHMQIKLGLNNKQTYKSQASCKIIKDSVIHLSIQPFFGLEMFVVRFTPDEIVLIDKANSVYYQTDYLFFKSRYDFDINYKTIEAIFTNQLFLPGKNQLHSDMFEIFSNEHKNIGLKHVNKQFTELVMLNPEYRIKGIDILSSNKENQFKTTYTGFHPVGTVIFPSAFNFSFQNNSQKLTFDLEIDKVSANELIRVPTVNLRNYRQGSIYSLLK